MGFYPGFQNQTLPFFSLAGNAQGTIWYGHRAVEGVRYLTAISKSGQVMKVAICLAKAVSTYLVFLKEHMAY